MEQKWSTTNQRYLYLYLIRKEENLRVDGVRLTLDIYGKPIVVPKS